MTDGPDEPLEELTPLDKIVPPSEEVIRHDQAAEVSGAYDEPTAVITGQPWPWDEGWVRQRSAGWLPDLNIILLVEDRITDQMIEELTGPVEFVLIASGPMVGLMIRFHGPDSRASGWEWQEVFSWRHAGDGLPQWAAPATAEPGGHLGFQIIVVDRLTRIVRYQAFTTVSPYFTSALIRECRDRWLPGVTPTEGLAARQAWNLAHPTIRSALKAALARSRSGD